MPTMNKLLLFFVFYCASCHAYLFFVRSDRLQSPRRYQKVFTFTFLSATSSSTIGNQAKGPGSKSVGIDLGTTFSLVSVVENSRSVILPVDGDRLLPSVVSYLPDGAILVGKPAIERQLTDPLNTYASVKRLAGRTMEQAKRTGDNLLFKKQLVGIYENTCNSTKTEEKCALRCSHTIHTQSGILEPEEVLSQIVKRLVDRGNEYFGAPNSIGNAIITVPAYFDMPQLNCIKKAGYLAGLQKVKLLKEPEAAALAYGVSTRKTQLLMVFDLGGGTLDISILEVGNGLVEVITSNGDAHLGGDDFDAAILNWIFKQLGNVLEKSIVDTMKASAAMKNHLLSKARYVKIELSTDRNATVVIDQRTWQLAQVLRILPKEAASTMSEMTFVLNRGLFEKLSNDLLQRILTPMRQAAYMAGVNLPGDSGQMSASKWNNEGREYKDDIGGMIHLDSASDVNSGEIGSQQVKDLEALQKLGRQEAKQRQKFKGNANIELKKVQKEFGSNVNLFPGGIGLDEVLLVGGATRMPCVVKLVRALTGIDPKRYIHPDEAVCLGAGVKAGILDGSIENVQILTSFQAEVVRMMYELSNRQQYGTGGLYMNEQEFFVQASQPAEYEGDKAVAKKKAATSNTGSTLSEALGKQSVSLEIGERSRAGLLQRLKKLKHSRLAS
ncbi:Hsp70 family protein [archaeon]|nr:MAG: Hsp70 family protein [archaeon]